MSTAAIEHSPVRAGEIVMIPAAIFEGVLATVLDWLRAESESESRIDRIPGATDAQVRHLTRLSALIADAVEDQEVPSALLEALKPAGHICVPAEVSMAFQRLLSSDPVTGLASVYAQTVAAANRRTLGTFFTPRVEATTMVREYAQRFPAPRQVVDVGAGVGVFSEAARAEWSNVQIDAIDINPVTLGLQAVALLQLGDNSTKLHLSDYRSWIEEFAPTGPTLYLGNPPYTRWQLIPMADRQRLIEASDGLLDARANLSTLFLAITLKKLRPQDALCLIVPANWMSARYARSLREYLREQRSRRVTLRFADSWRFDGAIVDAVVVEVGPEEADEQPLVTTDWPGSRSFQHLRSDRDSSPFARLGQFSNSELSEISEKTVRLGALANVTRGVATGANRFFVLTAEQVISRSIDPRWLAPLARRLRLGTDAHHPVVERGYLLKLGEYTDGLDADVAALIASAEIENVHKGHLCSQRGSWFDLSKEIRVPDVIMTSLGRSVFHFYNNTGKLTITNNLFGIYWIDGVADEQKDEALNWLKSDEGQQALLKSATTEANGLQRLSPRMLRDLRVPEASSIRTGRTSSQSARLHVDSE